jgi:hypothetical protein
MKCLNYAQIVIYIYIRNPILFAICTSAFGKLCKQRVQWHKEECSVALEKEEISGQTSTKGLDTEIY